MSARAIAGLLAAALLAGMLPDAAALTEEEKGLLEGTISAAQATERGRAADARALERIVALGDPQLVQSFDRGMQFARIERMPPDIEALVVAHFDDARVGAALRALTPRYARVASSVILTLPRMAFEIGQPCSPFSAASWNPAWSSPGTTPRTTSFESVTSTPPPSWGLSETVAVTSRRSGGVSAGTVGS